MTPEQIKEYNKTWYYSFTFGGRVPVKRFVSGRPIKVLGLFIGVLWKIARPNYPWNE
jgi:hypothetical protein